MPAWARRVGPGTLPATDCSMSSQRVIGVKRAMSVRQRPTQCRQIKYRSLAHALRQRGQLVRAEDSACSRPRRRSRGPCARCAVVPRDWPESTCAAAHPGTVVFPINRNPPVRFRCLRSKTERLALGGPPKARATNRQRFAVVCLLNSSLHHSRPSRHFFPFPTIPSFPFPPAAAFHGPGRWKLAPTHHPTTGVMCRIIDQLGPHTAKRPLHWQPLSISRSKKCKTTLRQLATRAPHCNWLARRTGGSHEGPRAARTRIVQPPAPQPALGGGGGWSPGTNQYGQTAARAASAHTRGSHRTPRRDGRTRTRHGSSVVSKTAARLSKRALPDAGGTHVASVNGRRKSWRVSGVARAICIVGLLRGRQPYVQTVSGRGWARLRFKPTSLPFSVARRWVFGLQSVPADSKNRLRLSRVQGANARLSWRCTD